MYRPREIDNPHWNKHHDESLMHTRASLPATRPLRSLSRGIISSLSLSLFHHSRHISLPLFHGMPMTISHHFHPFSRENLLFVFFGSFQCAHDSPFSSLWVASLRGLLIIAEIIARDGRIFRSSTLVSEPAVSYVAIESYAIDGVLHFLPRIGCSRKLADPISLLWPGNRYLIHCGCKKERVSALVNLGIRFVFFLLIPIIRCEEDS